MLYLRLALRQLENHSDTSILGYVAVVHRFRRSLPFSDAKDSPTDVFLLCDLDEVSGSITI